LSAVLLPALAGTKPNTIVAQCLENQRRLGQAFVLYTADYKGAIVPNEIMDGFIRPSGTWSKAGQTAAMSLQNFRTNVNSAANLLYEYGASSEIIHCPGDVRCKLTPGSGWAYDSYSKTDNVGGVGWGTGPVYTNLSQVTTPANTFAFREDADSRGYNQGVWVLNWQLYFPQFGHSESFTWLDPVPLYHGDVTTAAFVDGHAEPHKWADRAMIHYGLVAAEGAAIVLPNPPSPGPDYEYVYQNFRFPGWQQ